MKKLMRIGFISVFFILFLIGYIAVNNKSAVSAPGYQMSPVELSMAKLLLKDDMSMLMSGGGSFFGRELIRATGVDISREYDANQVAADQRYLNKPVLLKSRIQSIDSGLGNEPYVVLVGINQFLAPQARFIKGNIQKIASLKKGENVVLVCKGGGAVVGVPMLNSCQFFEDYASKHMGQLLVDISDFLAGKRSISKDVEKLAIGSVVLGLSLPDNSACRAKQEDIDVIKCTAEAKEVFKGINLSSVKKASVKAELESLGVPVSDFFNDKSN